jgi:hypothetical protein
MSMTTDDGPAFDLHTAFINKQTALNASFLAIRSVTTHPTTKGDQLEADWVGMLRDFLPSRYTVGPIFGVDHHGNMSEQIDVAVYDKHYSPQWFGGANGVRFVPVESVYAVFEVKPEWNSQNFNAAKQKAASVRSLDRTSASITHAGGQYTNPDRAGKPILAGILSHTCTWINHIAALDEHLVADHADSQFLNIGIALEQVCFDFTPRVGQDGQTISIERALSPAGQQLIHFAIRLFQQLQTIGTVPAVDMELYESAIRQLGAQ